MNNTFRPDYPPGIERAWLDMAARALGTTSDFQTLDRLTPLAGDLSDAFTIERQPRFQDYSVSRDHWFAYGTYFFPQTFIRMRYVLEECLAGKGWRPPSPSGPIRILDLGAGTGAATAATAITLASRFPDRPLQVRAVDASDTALDLLRALHAGRGAGIPRARLETRVGSLADLASAAGTAAWDIITVSFALNEVLDTAASDAAERLTRDALARLSPGGLLVMLEPALHTACERMQRLRDTVASRHLARIVAPCPHHLPCPMLAMPETWCHDVRRWRVPESVEYINRKLHRSVQFLKFCFLALAAEPAPAPDSRGIAYCRVVAPMTDPRGRICTYGCGADGLIHPYEVQTRDLDSEEKRAFLALDRGECVEWQAPRLLGDNNTVRGIPGTAKGSS